MKIKVELEKTMQVRQYEPLRVCISAEDDVQDLDQIKSMYKEVSSKLHAILTREYEKFDAEYNSTRTVEANSAKASSGIPRLKKKTTSKVVKASY